ncbi:tyrosinase cofactor [Streptomyces sp. IBSBF 2953]|uniref:tyrosinase cofactor n=1 Tax=Streptomyces TaxID=1883 RepID=UPI00211A581E|nr:tyrosinase cofactor [Streptomyces scabiei]MCQ9182199.1 tyrosinase cofactor [Streptomyces hayashii]MDX3117332.1 tyrosinase cofactor [Streptomyces scabiei]
MAVSVDGVPVSAVPAATARTAPARRARRRDLLRGLLGASAALAIAPVVAASRPLRPADGGPTGSSFDETYRGRHIRGVLTSSGSAAAAGAEWKVTVDGRPLHLMRRADGTWLSMVDHYRSYATPLEAVRAAVDGLGPGERLREDGPAHHHTHMGGHHGLHP